MAKNNADTPGLHLPWAGKKVDMARVEEELSRLWRMSADNVRIGQNTRVRTSVLNFVICAPDVESAQRASTLIRDLASTHIARVTLVILDTSSSVPSVETWVTLRSFPIISDLMRHSFEQITMTVAGAAVYSSATLIQPLLKPDLPVYLWWLNDPPADSAVFSRLADISSRIIVDSNTFFAPEQSLCALQSFMEEAPGSALSDLNWGRITPWRQLVAQFFDIPEYKSYLGGVHAIEIEHAVAPLAGHIRTEQGEISPNPTRALLFAAWLKASLNWQLDNDPAYHHHDPASGIYSWSMQRSTGPLPMRSSNSNAPRTARLGSSGQGRIYLRPRVQANLSPGSLCLVRLTSLIDNEQTIFTINREDDADHVLTSVELAKGTRPQRTVSLTATHKESELLHDELEIMGRDHLYEGALREVCDLLT